MGVFFILRVLPESYWKGWDPWLNTPIVLEIVANGITPFEIPLLFGDNVALSGFYYFLAATHVYTGIDLYLLNRYSGAVFAGITCVLVYLIVKKLEGSKAGIAAAFFLVLNPFFLERFVMPIRENFAFMFFLMILYFAIIRDQLTQKPQLNWTFLGVNSLFLAITLSSHSLTPVFAYGLLTLQLLMRVMKKKVDNFREVLITFLLSGIIAITFVDYSVSYLWKRVITHSSLSNEMILISLLSIPAILIVFGLYRKRIHASIRRFTFSSNKMDSRNLYIFIGILGLGSFIAMIFPTSFEILGQYQPPIELQDFAISTLPLAFVGLGIKYIKRNIPKPLLATAVLVLGMLNLPNLNVAFPQFRLILYCLLLLAYGAGKGFKFFYPNVSILSKEKQTEILLVSCIMFIVILTPFVILDVGKQTQFRSYYSQSDIDSSVIFVDSLNESDIVIPQVWTQYILGYAGLEKARIFYQRSNFVINTDIYNISDYDEFKEYIQSFYPNASRAFVFIIAQRIYDPNYITPPISMLNKNAVKSVLGTIITYEVDLD